MGMLEELQKKLDSEEGLKLLDEWLEERDNAKKILKSQLKRFHKKVKGNNELFTNIVDKLIIKYNSDEYVNRHYKRSYEPPTDLFWFLYEYASKYGKEASRKQYKKHANCFTGELLVINDFFIHIMHGQGSVVQVFKKD